MAYNKSPFKMVGKSPLMKQLIGKQSMLPEGLQAAIKASPAKKYGHSPAKQMEQDSSGATDAMTGKRKDRKARQDSSGVKDVMTGSPAKQLGKDAGETAAFEKSAQIEDKFNSKIEKAAGNDKKIAKLNKRANNKMARKVPRAQKRADKKGYDMNNFDGTTTRLVGKDEKSSPAKQVKVKDLPKKAVETGEKIVQGVKNIGKKIGNITLSSKERQDCKKAGGRFKKGTCYMPKAKEDKSSK